MRTLSATLTTASKAAHREPYVKFTFSLAGEDDVVIEQDRVLSIPSHEETEDSQTVQVAFNNSDGYFTSLDFKGWQVVMQWGLKTSSSIEYSALPPMKVLDQNLVSLRGVLRCTMSFIGIPDQLAEDKASADYLHDRSDTKTVKDLITEIASGTAVDTELTESQDTGASYLNLNNVQEGVGQLLTVSSRTITKISFKLKKVGTPAGTNVTFRIDSVATGLLASKVFPITSITTDAAWCEATLDTPLLVNEAVWIWVNYSDGDANNYIQVAYNNGDIKNGENLIRVATGGNPVDYSGQDCAYRYKYTATGISVFSHCTAYTVVYDSEDSLIDVYQPADGFKIYENSTRLDAINFLLAFTGCDKVVKADGKIHVYVATTTGTTYNYEYALGTGNHEFFSKSTRSALVIPNKITVHSYPDDADQYTGSYTDATSYALVPKDSFVRAKLSSNAQATSIATAMIGRLQMSSQRGSAIVPMNLGAEIHDYVKVTDSRQSDSRVGNIGYIKRWYIPGQEFNMSFSFSKLAITAVRGYKSSRLFYKKNVTPVAQAANSGRYEDINDLYEIADLLSLVVEQNAKEIADLKTRVNYTYDDELTSDQIDSSLIGYLQNVVEDLSPELGGNLDAQSTYKIQNLVDPTADQEAATKKYVDDNTGGLANVVEDLTPQLGGDLDLNGKNLDFPTTPNVSDCLDEDTMVSDSATKLATQQSIKAYADARFGTSSQPARAKSTTYTNSTGKAILVSIVVTLPNTSNAILYIHASADPPTTAVAAGANYNAGNIGVTLTGVVPNGWKYRLTESVGTITVDAWTEWA